jgi:pyruvate formate lyase activating enzyme
VAYTYNEPMIWFEYVLDAAKAVRKRGMKNVLVTNGYVSEEPLKELLPYIDAMNIDLKAFDPGFYKNIVRGGLADVQNTIVTAAKACHVEVTTLLVPGKNDGEDEIDALARWLRSVSPGMTLHLTRYHPDYRLDTPAMPRERVYALADIARQSLEHVFCGNV